MEAVLVGAAPTSRVGSVLPDGRGAVSEIGMLKRGTGVGRASSRPSGFNRDFGSSGLEHTINRWRRFGRPTMAPSARPICTRRSP